MARTSLDRETAVRSIINEVVRSAQSTHRPKHLRVLPQEVGLLLRRLEDTIGVCLGKACETQLDPWGRQDYWTESCVRIAWGVVTDYLAARDAATYGAMRDE